jgi:peptide methionine sulfoxide reductase MsrA
MRTALIISIMLTGLLVAINATAEAPSGMAKATFAVHCYDVGASVLDGKPGVVSVERGTSGARELDRVVYDPEQVSLGQLENWLKAADTYVGTLESTTSEILEKEMSQ